MKNLPLIAIVDDDDSVRESLRGLTRAVGFGVEVIAVGECSQYWKGRGQQKGG